mgnify:CR=1 FL=1
MASRDILVLNTTASRAETQQGSDTVAIRGDSSKILSVENSSGVSVLSVDSYLSLIHISEPTRPERIGLCRVVV